MMVSKRYDSLESAILFVAQTRKFDKTPAFHSFIDLALEHHNSLFDPNEITSDWQWEIWLTDSLAEWESKVREERSDFSKLQSRLNAWKIELADIEENKRIAQDEEQHARDALASLETQRENLLEEIEARFTKLEEKYRNLSDESERAHNTRVAEMGKEFTSMKEKLQWEMGSLEWKVTDLKDQKISLDDNIRELSINRSSLSDIQSIKKIVETAHYKSLSAEGKKLQDSVLESGWIVIEILDIDELEKTVFHKESLKHVLSQAKEDHGKFLEKLPRIETKTWLYVVYPDVFDGWYNKTVREQQDIIKGEMVTIDGKISLEWIIPDIHLLLYILWSTKHQIIANTSDEICFRTNTIVQDFWSYDQNNAYNPWDFYDVTVQAEKDHVDIDIWASEKNAISPSWDIKEDDGGNTTLLKIYKAK